MPWFRRKKKNPTERKSTPIVWPIEQGSVLDLSLRFGQDQYAHLSPSGAFAFYRKNSTVQADINMIAKEVEKLKPRLQGPDGRFDDDAEVLERLRRPNDRETYKRFVGKQARDFLITGTTYTYVSGVVRQPPVEIYAVDPRNVTYQLATDHFASDFLVESGVGSAKYLLERVPRVGVRYYSRDEMRELFAISNYSTDANNRVIGDSLLRSAILDINSLVKSKFHNVKVLDNSGRLSLLVTFNDGAGGDELKARKEALINQLTGTENAGSIAVIGQDGVRSEGAPMTIQEMGQSNRDMDYQALVAEAKESIHRTFDIPLPLITLDAATFNNFETAVEYFYHNAVLPLADTLFEGWSANLLPRYGLDASKWRITYNKEEIDALQRGMISMLKERASLGVETTNEIRSLLPGREPIEGGDTLYQPANLVAIGTDVFTEDNAQTTNEAEALAATRIDSEPLE